MRISRKRNKRNHNRTRKAKKYKAKGGENISWGEDCKYVSSRAIMKLCKVHSPNPESSTKTIDDIDFTQVVDGCTVYITGSAIPAFVNKLNTLPGKIILVSGDCDESIPEAIFPTDQAFKAFIESDKIIHWFSQNCVGNHPKLSGIPIGLNYHTKKDTSLSPTEQEALLNQVKTGAKPLLERLVQCYSNFHFSKNKEHKYTYNRDDAIDKIPKDLIFYEPSRINLKDTYINQCKYAFVVSPHGNGLDCHRTWEALCLGSIPIVKTSPLDTLYSELPVLIVKNWSDVTKSLLDSTLIGFKDKQYKYDKLTLKYWMDKINSANVKLGGSLNSKKHYHIYNIYHYGDHIFNLKFFFGIVDILKQHNIFIHYYYDPGYIKNLDELTRYVNPEVVILDTLDKKPADAFNMWMDAKGEHRKIETAIGIVYKDVLVYLGLENLPIDTSIYQKEDYLIDIYNNLDPKFKDLKVLILNNEPKSAQFDYNKENMDAMCMRLASKFKVAVISPVNNIPCTLTDGLKMQDIGAISTGAEYIIGFNSGPLTACFNIHTKNKVKKWIILDTMGTKINEINVDFVTKETNVNSKIVQTGGVKKYRFRTKKTKKINNIYKRNQKGGDVNFIFCLLTNGLGNELFKYANALILKNILNIPILLFNTIFKAHTTVDHRPFFKKGEPKNEAEFRERIDKAEILPVINGHDDKPYLAKIPEYKMKDIKLDKEFNHIYTLIKDVIPVIKSDFISELKLKYPEFEASILNGVTREDLAFMHVRKGDYDSYKWSSPSEYFISALNIIDTIPEIKIVYILSDDIAYCKEQINTNRWKSTKELKIYDEADELKCMYLMSLCNGGGILSASTFSWWGAMFGPNDSTNSIILYPNNIKYNNDVRLSFPAQVGNKWRMISEIKGGGTDNTIVIYQPWGGLGDNLQFTTLPELYSKDGKDVYISSKNVYRSDELYDLIWKLNPYIKGISDLPENAGASKGIPPSTDSFIKNIELAHGLRNGYRKYPVIYYKPKKIEGIDGYIFYDSSYVSSHKNNTDFTASFKSIFDKYPTLIPNMIKFKKDFKNVKLPVVKTPSTQTYEINDIEHFCDLLYSCKVFVTGFSGSVSLASAVKQDSITPEIYSFYSEPKPSSTLYKFDNIIYNSML